MINLVVTCLLDGEEKTFRCKNRATAEKMIGYLKRHVLNRFLEYKFSFDEI